MLIIGGGVSGICAARYLTAAGIACLIAEKSPSLGGTWFDNHYPGAGVDTPSHLYSFSFAKNDWARYFSAAADIRRYLENVAAGLGEGCEIRLGTEVLRAAYQPAGQEWQVDLRGPDGHVRQERASVVISAVGALNRPVLPRIEGLDRFRGPSFHTARWPADLDLRGKRVAVIGTGASAMQIVPAIKDTVAELTIFQRSPQWAVPFEKFQQEIPAAIRALFRAVPLYERWYRLRLSWTFNDKIHSSLQRDRRGSRSQTAPRSTRSMTPTAGSSPGTSAGTGGPRRPAARGAAGLPAVPEADAAGQRVVPRPHRAARSPHHRPDRPGHGRRGGHHGRRRGNPAPRRRAHPGHRLRCDPLPGLAGSHRPGRADLREAWDGDDARAYLGTAVPGFPNFFTMYGPNLQPGHGGSLMFIFECQMHYIVDLLQQMFRQDAGAAECRKDAYDQYNRGVDQAHATMVWTHPGASTYYRNSRGRVVVNNPYRVIDYWHMTRHADLADYIVEPEVARLEVPGTVKTPLAEP